MFSGDENKVSSSTWIFSTGNTGSFIIVAFLQNFMSMTALQRKQTLVEVWPISLILQEEVGGGRGRVHHGRQTVDGSIASLIRWRHSEKCFSLVAAIYFLVLICALWQGFWKETMNSCIPPSPNCCSPCQNALRMMQVCISLIRKRGFQMALESICGSRVCRFGLEELWNTAEALNGILRVRCQTFCCFSKIF